MGRKEEEWGNFWNLASRLQKTCSHKNPGVCPVKNKKQLANLSHQKNKARCN